MSARPATNAPSTELAPVPPQPLTLQQRALAALGERDEAALTKLAEGTKDITTITNAAGYQQVHAARMVLKNKRISIEKDAKKARQDAVDFGKAVIAEEGRLIAIVAGEEKRLQTLQDVWDAEIERIRQEKIEVERQRVAALQTRVDEIRQYPLNIVGTSSANIENILKTVVGLQIDDSYAELKQQAEGAKATTLIRLRAALANAQTMEAEQKRLAEERAAFLLKQAEEEKRQAAERAENERIRKENEAAAAAERARLAESVRLAKEELERERLRNEALADIERGRVAEEERQANAALNAQAAAERKRLADQAAALQAERDAQAAEAQRIAAIQAELDAAQRVEAQRIATERAQLERDQEALRLEREKAAQVIGGRPYDAYGNPLFPPTALVDEPALQSGSVAPESVVEPPVPVEPEAEPLTASLDLKVYLLMESVCKFAKEWAVFQQRDSKLEQKTDRALAKQAREAEANLLAVVEQLP